MNFNTVKYAVLFSLVASISACSDDTVKKVAKAIAEDDAPAQTAEQQPAQTLQQQPQQQPQQIVLTETQPAQQMPAQDLNQVDIAALPPKPVPQRAQQQAPVERVTRKRAYVLTQYGGTVLVRNHPSRNGRKLGHLYDAEEIWVVGETNRCETINGLYGCWVKVVDSVGLSGYSFGAYLQY